GRAAPMASAPAGPGPPSRVARAARENRSGRSGQWKLDRETMRSALTRLAIGTAGLSVGREIVVLPGALASIGLGATTPCRNLRQPRRWSLRTLDCMGTNTMLRTVTDVAALQSTTLCEAFQTTAAERGDAVALRRSGDGVVVTWSQYAG